jgi:uncharacterized membrane protein YbhN (UPF0104 family)
MIQGLRLLLGLGISVFCLWLVLNGFLGNTSMTKIIENIGGISIKWGALALSSLILSYPLNTLRLKYILSSDQTCSCSFLQVLSIVWGSAFLSLTMPSAAFADGIRAALLRGSRISNLSLAVRAVLIDRSMGLIYTIGLAGILLLMLPPNINPKISTYWSLVFLASFLGATAMLFLGSKVVNKIQLFARLRNLVNGMRQLMSSPSVVILFLGFAAANTIISALGLWCIARGLSVDIGFWIFFMLTPAILIVNNLPIFYQGFGGREATMLFAFGNSQSAMTPDLIVTISLVSGVVMIVSALIGSIFVPFLLFRRNNLPST